MLTGGFMKAGVAVGGAGALLVGGMMFFVTFLGAQVANSVQGNPCLLVTPTASVVASAPPGPSAGPSATAPATPGGICGGNSAVAKAALAIAQHLHGDPDVNYDVGMPQAVLNFWAQSCPAGSGCYADWQNGSLQCVMLVTGAYAYAGVPLPAAGNAFDFWSLYANRPGWIEVPSALAPAGQRGLPAPGDIMVWWDPPPLVGHVAIVVGVVPPANGQNGSVTFAEANGPGPVVTETLLPDLTVVTWSNPIHFVVYGYIRSTTALVALAQQDAQAAGISPGLFVRQINVESGFNPKALSPKGAEGIAQFLPSTAACYMRDPQTKACLSVNPWDPVASLAAAAGLMASYAATYGGDYAKALAAYNAGTAAVTYAESACGAAKWQNCLPAETQHYIQLIMGM